MMVRVTWSNPESTIDDDEPSLQAATHWLHVRSMLAFYVEPR
jgi:hypothetical protein